MDAGIITLKEVLATMLKGELFSIRYYTYSAKRKTGGKKKVYSGCRLTWQPQSERSEPRVAAPAVPGAKRANHFKNRTRNIVLPTGETRTINIWFITGFNGKDVTPY